MFLQPLRILIFCFHFSTPPVSCVLLEKNLLPPQQFANHAFWGNTNKKIRWHPLHAKHAGRGVTQLKPKLPLASNANLASTKNSSWQSLCNANTVLLGANLSVATVFVTRAVVVCIKLKTQKQMLPVNIVRLVKNLQAQQPIAARAVLARTNHKTMPPRFPA